MRNKDILYVSNAYAVETTKAMTYFNTVNATIQAPNATVTSAYGLRYIITVLGRCPVSSRPGDDNHHDAGHTLD